MLEALPFIKPIVAAHSQKAEARGSKFKFILGHIVSLNPVELNKTLKQTKTNLDEGRQSLGTDSDPGPR